MKIVTVGYLHGAGGAERQIILLSNQLALRGHEVVLCVLAENKSPYPIDNKVRIVDVSDVENGTKSSIGKIYKRLVAFRKVIKQERPDVIIHYNLQSAYFCLTLSSKKRGKVIYSERGDPYDAEYSGLLGKIRDYTIKRMDGLVFQSEGARDFFSDDVIRKSIVIHNSVNVPQDKYPIPKIREKRIINVGRFHPQKNQKLLINAFSKISKSFPDYVLEMYGDGDLYDELKKQVGDLGLDEKVFFHPSRKDLWDCIYKASLFVLSSDFEGMPNALMEAMALGLPCISTDCRPGGARSLIQDGVNGMIVPVGNVDELAKAMTLCLSKKDISEKIAKNARTIMETHCEKALFDKWSDYLKLVLLR
ncbi:glycosyltransferase [Prevotella sp. MA2016]|uniref:glycosyltransferase n=1 Tax=Prevotella sp. MA2016 TaxID=1408310 RepID=UPI000490345B|nr:glycosyltransferase [Prevotella sp. MA2016]